MDLYIYLNLGIIAIMSVYLILIGFEWLAIRRQSNNRYADNYKLICVRVDKNNETGPLVAEQIFATLHSIVNDISFWDRLKGANQEKISLEIANVGRSIKFFVHFPEKLRNLVEGQIYAQYPYVEIQEIEDYTIEQEVEIADQTVPSAVEDVNALVKAGSIEKPPFKKVNLYKNAVGAELGLTSFDFYPIKTYQEFEDSSTKMNVDPLSGITSTLAKFSEPDEQAWIQVVASPISEKKRDFFEKCYAAIRAKKLKFVKKFYYNFFYKGSALKKIVFFPITLIFGPRKSAGKSDGGEEKPSKKDLAATDKLNSLLFNVNVRIVYIPKIKNQAAAAVKVREIAGSFKQFNQESNGFKIRKIYKDAAILADYQERKLEKPFLLDAKELATIYHLPNNTVATPNIFWVRSKKLEPPNDLPIPSEKVGDDVTTIGETNYRGLKQKFGIKTLDRRRHMYIIGKTGMGKTTLLENMIFSDIRAGKGVAVIDPHGDLAELVIDFVPSYRTNEVVIFDPSDREFPIAFNMLENVDPALNTIVASGLVGIFKKIYANSWGPRLEHILRNTILSLLEYPGTTMLGIPRVLQDKDYRRKVVRKITDPVVRSFWENEFEKMEPRQRIEAISPILNKVGQFLSSPIIRNILGQVKSTVDFRFAMDNHKIVIVNLSKGKIGEDNSSLLGAMLITKFQIDAMSRADIPEKDRKDFYLYVDEFQNFATDSFATILSEARKYRLNLTMANQYIAQMSDEVKDAVFGNVGSILSYQVGVDDAEYLSQQFSEQATPFDMTNLSKFTAYMRLLIDGMPSQAFSLNGLPPPDFEFEEGRREKVIRLARERYCVDRATVEDKINRWSKSIVVEDKKVIKEPGNKKAAASVEKVPEVKAPSSSKNAQNAG